ncbi:MAG: hypothetical protein D3917_05310 [Candidatus Electrothrix sp. AX5]|nr:hypothetical protein [Candidatus Electrothrix sp. AX5]
MANSYICFFSSVNKKDTAEVGGKGANLGELTKAGFPVPPGFVVTAQTYSDFFTSLCPGKQLDQLAKARPNELERYCAPIRESIISTDLPSLPSKAIPVSGAEEIVTESSWGMGAAIVDGRVTPDRYILDRKTLQLRERRIACKRFMVSSALWAGAESRLKKIPPDMQQQETLPAPLLDTVANWAIRIEEHFGSPQDLEWAIADNAFYLLQSRPITGIGFTEQTNDPDGQYVLFKPYLENMTEPLTPMTADLLSRVVFPVCRLIDGWVYLNLKVLRPLIPFKLSDQEVADLFYDLSIGIHLPLKRIAWLKLPLKGAFHGNGQGNQRTRRGSRSL